MSVYGYQGTPRSNDEWVAALQADGTEQQRAAFEELGSFLRRRIFQDIYRRASSLPALAQLAASELEAVTDEVVQESLIRIYQKLDIFADSGNFLNFALIIARNLMIDGFRKKRWTTIPLSPIAERSDAHQSGRVRSILDEFSDSRQTLDNTNAVYMEMTQIVFDAINEDLSQNQATAFVAYEFRNLSSREIAELIGKSPSAVDQLRFQAREKIKKRLAQRGYTVEDLTSM